MAKQPLEELFSVTIRQAPEVAKLLKTTAPKVKAMILNHTLPIGCVSEGAEGEVDRVIIIEERLRAWLDAEDLKGGRKLQ